MSWEVVIFKQNRRITNQQSIDEGALVDIGSADEFRSVLTGFFPDVHWENDWGVVEHDDHSIEFTIPSGNKRISNTMFFLNGTNAIYPIIEFCREYKLQAFDTRGGAIIDLEHPEKSGFPKYKDYMAQKQQ